MSEIWQVWGVGRTGSCPVAISRLLLLQDCSPFPYTCTELKISGTTACSLSLHDHSGESSKFVFHTIVFLRLTGLVAEHSIKDATLYCYQVSSTGTCACMSNNTPVRIWNETRSHDTGSFDMSVIMGGTSIPHQYQQQSKHCQQKPGLTGNHCKVNTSTALSTATGLHTLGALAILQNSYSKNSFYD
jgi:hypothetical protein